MKNMLKCWSILPPCTLRSDQFSLSLSVSTCRVVLVLLDLRVSMEAVVLLVCLDREEREVSLA